MALTPSNMLPLGTKAPDFELLNVITNTNQSLESIKGVQATVIMFICNHCPFVKHVNTEISKLAKDYISKGVGFIAISSNDADNYPEDHPQKLKEQAINNDFKFPYLYDQTQQAAKDYLAACTPDFFVFDSDLKLIYRGQLDDSRPGNDKCLNGEDIRHALDCAMEGTENARVQKPSIGCNIKWK
ncbi:thioredoxin family protein [Hanstruepera neustonica]|uniref:Thioredoxin family protein n=1 Tax=Hanstruepera neustonica TaxID=1445657 RepID=A0A2K1DVK3_9FLAO|nr:thioredoxin family protein [Hanstruepera neustonica]PNQ72070.1 thioredoxin family protein [Hanstruepera neustonica]